MIYLSGPMTGMPDFNFHAFRRAAAAIRAKGYRVVSPAEMDESDSVPTGERPWEEYLRRDLIAMLGCESVAVLEGWQKSRGATLEVHVARALGMPILDWHTLEPIEETVLEEAQRLIYGDRNADYGHPLDDFTRTGRMWAPILEAHWKPGEGVPAEAVALCMVQVKVSRECNHPKRDNRVDGPGYFGCLDMIHAERKRRGG